MAFRIVFTAAMLTVFAGNAVAENYTLSKNPKIAQTCLCVTSSGQCYDPSSGASGTPCVCRDAKGSLVPGITNCSK
jgi:mannitol-1-phosphate/altronate dehydrogenase